MNAKTVLLVEDDFLNRRLSKKILKENGYEVFEAKNADEAIATLKKEAIDLVILDINLGEGERDGISIGKQIYEKFQIPFIYLTAYENPTIISAAATTFPYSYLTKPFKNSDLIASVEIAITKSVKNDKRKPFILVKDDDYKVELPTDEINYIESDGNYLLFHTDKKNYKCRLTIAQAIELLPASIFVQVHRAFIVNRNKIEKFSTKSVVVRNVDIPVSKHYLTNLDIDVL
jgi:DNA-binding LytR/AlgR family response regulator